MSLFQVPPETRYDLRFQIFAIPVRVHPAFWLIAILFGASSGSLLRIVNWVAVLFVSILIHELGHSLMMRRFDVDSFIVLHFMGGLAVPTGSWRGGRGNRSSLSTIPQILISLAGPFAGFTLAALVLVIVRVSGGAIFINWIFGVLPLPTAFAPWGPAVNSVISSLLWVNIFWGLINLAPVIPLDGGNVSRQLFVHFDPWQGIKKALWLSVIAGVVVAVGGYVLLDSIWMAFLFGILALQSYQALQGRV